jgi:hypothetical protein
MQHLLNQWTEGGMEVMLQLREQCGLLHECMKRWVDNVAVRVGDKRHCLAVHGGWVINNIAMQ